MTVPKRPPGREADVLSGCLQLLKLRGVTAWRTNNVGVYDPNRKCHRTFKGRKGISDVLGILPPGGRLLAVECKRPGGKATRDQIAFLSEVRAAGGVAVVVDDVVQLDELLTDLGC